MSLLRLVEAGDHAARLAFDVYCYRIRMYVGACTAALGRVDAASGRAAAVVSPEDSPVAVLVVPTDEEWEIARQSLTVVRR
jgi:acetate kinase